MIKSLKICGFRGYGIEQVIKFSIPNGNEGSGLTFIVGANNSGKTTINEVLKAFNGHNPPSISEGKRNIINNNRIELELLLDNDEIITIKTVQSGGSETEKSRTGKNNIVYCLPSRRFVDHEFGEQRYNRDSFITNNIMLPNRKPSESNLVYRLQDANKNKYSEFNQLLKKLVGKDIQWTIEKRDNGNLYIKYMYGNYAHSAEGVGDGIISIFTICDSLYDSSADSTIYIDEPELSLHPALQKRVMKVLREYSKDKQIIINTHSPYFIDWESIFHGATLIRVYKDDEDNNSKIACLERDIINNIQGFLYTIDNPHILGINANEIFFLDDNIILTEGQDDVIIYQKIAKILGIDLNGSFYGWGSGGANNITKLMKLFNNLKYKKVIAIFDKDKEEEARRAEELFPHYKVLVLKENDIRDKRRIPEKYGKIGIVKSDGTLKEENREYITSFYEEICQYLDM